MYHASCCGRLTAVPPAAFGAGSQPMNYCSLDPGVPACAPLPWLRRSLASWLAAGVPRAKLVPILPWCARCCSGAATARERLARPGKIIATTLAAD